MFRMHVSHCLGLLQGRRGVLRRATGGGGGSMSIISLGCEGANMRGCGGRHKGGPRGEVIDAYSWVSCRCRACPGGSCNRCIAQRSCARMHGHANCRSQQQNSTAQPPPPLPSTPSTTLSYHVHITMVSKLSTQSRVVREEIARSEDGSWSSRPWSATRTATGNGQPPMERHPHSHGEWAAPRLMWP